MSFEPCRRCTDPLDCRDRGRCAGEEKSRTYADPAAQQHDTDLKTVFGLFYKPKEQPA